MALKALMLRRSIDNKTAQLDALRKKSEEFATREAELEAAINEATTTEEEQAVSEMVDQFAGEKDKHDAEVQRLSAEIAELEKQLADTEAAQPAKPAEQNRAAGVGHNDQKREDNNHMNNIEIRSLPMGVRAFDALPMERRQAIVQQPETQEMLAQLRSMPKTRAITGAGLTIPVTILDIISENRFRYSKLLRRVRELQVAGQARQTIVGTAPEAVWTEMCAAINELTFGFNQIVVDGYKVAGYIPICNSLLEDSDVNLAAEIVEMISQAIGLAIDKAILYGKGSAYKMPMGIVTRLAQTAQPTDYPATAPAWVDLHTTNIQQIASTLTGAEFWRALMLATGNTYTPFNRGNMFWAMNSKTYALLRSKALTITADGAIVASVYGTLPVVTGDVDVLEFIPDGDIIGGYGNLYLWARRAGMQIDMSTEVQFIQDNTVFRGKERADGTPIVPGAFVAININGTAVTTDIPFAADLANYADLDGLTVGTYSLSPAFDADNLAYTVTATKESDVVIATPAAAGSTVAISYNGKNVRNGGTVAWETGTLPLTVTVENGNGRRVYTVNVTKAASGG